MFGREGTERRQGIRIGPKPRIWLLPTAYLSRCTKRDAGKGWQRLRPAVDGIRCGLLVIHHVPTCDFPLCTAFACDVSWRLAVAGVGRDGLGGEGVLAISDSDSDHPDTFCGREKEQEGNTCELSSPVYTAIIQPFHRVLGEVWCCYFLE